MTVDVRQRLPNNGTTAEDIPNEVNDEKPKVWDPLTDGVKWIERYAGSLDKFFERIPDFLGTIVATLGIFTFGATLRGEWIVILVSALKQLSGHTQVNKTITPEELYNMFSSENLKMQHFWVIMLGVNVVSYSMYFVIGGFLHWYFYMNRRHLAKEWKLQPTKWITPELEKDEIMIGTISLLVTGTFSAFLATYIFNGNPSTVYFQFDEYGWLWFFLQFPVLFIYMDYTTYIMHRLYHTPWLYRKFHKLHHKYKQPTAFSVTAIHPVEIVHIQLTLCLPLFIMPVHYSSFYSIALYNYYHGILEHSGIDFKAYWWQPWQPDTKFHDLHHEFTHVNFGFNMFLWDKIHGTTKKPGLVYTEDLYHGQALVAGTPEAIEAEKKEKERNLLCTIEKTE